MTDRDERPHIPSTTRRILLLGAGAAGAMGVLAACGGDDAPDAATAAPTSAGGRTTPPPPTVTSAAADAGIAVAQIPVGGGMIFKEQKVVVTQPTQGTFKAFGAGCTHGGCSVTEIKGSKLVCTCHGSEFDLTDGSVTRGPATRALQPKQVTVTGETLTIA